MNTAAYKEFLLSNIKPWARPGGGGRMVICRCFYCSDSKHKNHGHFYISIPQNEKEPSLFYCQKCKTGGVVTQAKLLEWGVYDPDIAVEITQYNAKVMSLPENRIYKDSTIYKIYNDQISEDKLSQYKLNYINQRLGANLSFQDCINLKIVLNLSDLLKRNHLDITRDPNIIDQLDSGFLGFLSYDNAFLNMRNLDIVKNIYKGIDMRYVNYNIFGKYDNTKRFYTIPTQIDLLDPRPLQLHIAEGPFDILSIYTNLRDHDRSIFSSIGGSGYAGLLRIFICELKCPNMEIHIYPDNDISRDYILDIIDILRPFKYTFYIHRNLYPGEKDFGVSANKIQETIERIDYYA